jgi:catechol 2,3-dioxygenase-like lactoylglutathione lyase family enzyme
MTTSDQIASVRYIVDDVDAAIAFYTSHLGFTVNTNFSPAFADVIRGPLRLLLSGPTSSAGRALTDGSRPEPGGWNRIHLIVDDLDTEIERLRTGGLSFPNDVVAGPGGRQILLADPAGNLIELFEERAAVRRSGQPAQPPIERAR